MIDQKCRLCLREPKAGSTWDLPLYRTQIPPDSSFHNTHAIPLTICTACTNKINAHYREQTLLKEEYGPRK